MRVRSYSVVVSALFLVGTLSYETTLATPPEVDRALRRMQLQRRALQVVNGEKRPLQQQARSVISDNFEVLGHVTLGGKASDADVTFHHHGGNVGKYAYVGTWAFPCTGRGVKIVNVNRPKHARVVAVARLKQEAVSYEDPNVVRIGSRVVLGVGVQGCDEGGRGGLALFNVTRPEQPRRLAFFPTGSNGVHEMDMVVREGGRALALLAVPFGEVSGHADLQIIGISRPKHPVKVGEWGIIRDSSLPVPSATDPALPMPDITTCCQGLGYVADFFFHSVRAADKGMTLYASHWDAGVLKFDIANPAAPKLVGRTTYPFNADGDAHSVTTYDAGGKRYILQNDEDFQPLSPAHIRTSVTGKTKYAAIEEPWMPTVLSETGTVRGKLHDAGQGCDAEAYTGAAGKIVLVNAVAPFGSQDPPCGLGRQVLLAAKSDAKALVINFLGPDRPSEFYSPSPKTLETIRAQARNLPVVAIGSIDKLAQEVRAERGDIRFILRPRTPSWGYLRIFSEASTRDENGDDDGDDVVQYEQVGHFRDLPHVSGEFPARPGFWSIHNTEVYGNRAYSSWYSHGIVALDLTNPTRPVKVGQFVPPGQGRDIGLPSGIASVWGVEIDRKTGVIYASDERSGLWIIRPTGAAAP